VAFERLRGCALADSGGKLRVGKPFAATGKDTIRAAAPAATTPMLATLAAWAEPEAQGRHMAGIF